MRVLVVEDEPTVSDWVAKVLGEAGYLVDVAPTADDAQERALSIEYDLVLLDLNLPDRSGLGVIHALRRSGKTVPIIIVTGRDDDDGIVIGLDAGADDYLVKPVSNSVLRARVRAALRRGGAKQADELRHGKITLDRLRRTVRVENGKGPVDVDLTPKEFSLLEDFLLHPREVLSRSDLLERVWGLRFVTGTNVVDATVSRLRQKLADAGAPPAIRSVHGVGFVLKDE